MNETTGNEDTITIIKSDGSKIENVENTTENIAKAKEDGYTVELNNKTSVPQETDEGYDPEYNTGLDRSVTEGQIRRLKRGNTTALTRKQRLEAREIELDYKRKQKKLLEDKKRNEALKLPEVKSINSE